MSVRVFAPAKINLTLQVGAPRADGMHPLQSAVMFADVGDWIEAEEADALTLRIEGPFAGELSAEDNLVLRAAQALGAKHGASLVLQKNLPVASGIGGGSSDAAATLKALNRLWGLGVSEADLSRIGVALGADVPVCLAARSAWMTGIGEALEELSAPPLHAVLVNPRRALSTADVFRAFDQAAHGRILEHCAPPSWPAPADAAKGAASFGNDLAPSARALMPAIAKIESALGNDARVIYASLSGSGATCFGLARTRAEADALALELSAARPDWWVCATTLGALDQDQVQG